MSRRFLAAYGETLFFDTLLWIVCRVVVSEKSAGCSKSSTSKAAVESKPEAYPRGYVEDFDEPRTKLADFFSILLLRVPVFEGEFRDGGFIQLAFAQRDQSLILIVGRLS